MHRGEKKALGESDTQRRGPEPAGGSPLGCNGRFHKKRFVVTIKTFSN